MFKSFRMVLLIALPFLVLSALSPNAAKAQQNLNDPFKPSWTGPSELRYLQTGLALQGLYVGLIDGEWGAGSQRALDTYMARRGKTGTIKYKDLKPLLLQTQTAIQVDFWQGVNDFPRKATFLAPLALLQQDPSSELFTLQSPDNSLKVRMIENDQKKTIDMHKWLIDNHKGTKQELYQKYDDKRLITSGILKSGKTVYLRSQVARAGMIVTVLVQYEPSQKARGTLIAASISFSEPAYLGLHSDSVLGQILRGAAPSARPSQPVSGGGISRPAPGTDVQPAQPGTGSGGGGIARPSVPIASGSFMIPSIPGSE